MTQVAVKTETLDELIANTLSAKETFTSEFLGHLITDVSIEIACCDRTSKEGRAASIDPTRIDGIAQRARAEDAEFCASRLRAGHEKLKQLHAAAVKREAVAAFNERSRPTRDNVNALAQELASVLPETVKKLVDLFRRCAAADKEAMSLEHYRPSGSIPLCTVEASITGGHKIIEKIRLSALTAEGVVEMWPPRNDWQADYFNSVSSMMQAGPPRQTEAERIAESKRQMDFVRDQERGREQKNAAAAERAAAVRRDV